MTQGSRNGEAPAPRVMGAGATGVRSLKRQPGIGRMSPYNYI